MENLKSISANEILERYVKGEKDFSNSLLNGIILAGVNLKGAIFKNCWVKGATFRFTDLTDANFEGSTIDYFASMRGANLTRTNFRNTKIHFVYAENAILDKTDFTNADLLWVGFPNCRRGGANFTGAKMVHVIWSYEEVDVEKAIEAALPHMLEADIPLNRKIEMKAFTLSLLDKVKTLAKSSNYNVKETSQKIFDLIYSPDFKENLAQYGAGGSKYSEKMEYQSPFFDEKKGKLYKAKK